MAVAETKQNSDCLNERKDVKGDDLTHFPIQRQQFKEALQNSISAKRAAARMRKQEESKLDNEEEAESEEEEAEEEELGFGEINFLRQSSEKSNHRCLYLRRTFR